MQGKTKGFFEDTGLILVLVALIYGGYYVYTKYFNSDLNSIDKTTEVVIMKNIEGPLEGITLEIDNSQVSDIQDEESIENISEVKEEEIEVLSDLDEKVEIPKEETIKVKIEETITENTEVKKEVDRKSLKRFLNDVKDSISNSIVKKDDINSTQSQELKIRITILKDGSYEQLSFVEGDKELFEINKENILKVFPLSIDDSIKGSFPRYLRMSIK